MQIKDLLFKDNTIEGRRKRLEEMELSEIEEVTEVPLEQGESREDYLERISINNKSNSTDIIEVSGVTVEGIKDYNGPYTYEKGAFKKELDKSWNAIKLDNSSEFTEEKQKDFIDTSKDYYHIIYTVDEDNLIGRGPYLDRKECLNQASNLKDIGAETKIAKLVFLEDERDEGDESSCVEHSSGSSKCFDLDFKLNKHGLEIYNLAAHEGVEMNISQAKDLQAFLNKNIKG